MKIAIATLRGNLEAQFAPRFDRVANFIIVDTETEEWKVYPNPIVNANSDVGAQVAHFIANQGVQAVIAGYFCPPAARVLAAAGIRMFLASRTARELLACYREDQLKQVMPPSG